MSAASPSIKRNSSAHLVSPRSPTLAPSSPPSSRSKPASAPPPPPTAAQQYGLEGDAEELLLALDAVLSGKPPPAVAKDKDSSSAAFEQLFRSADALAALFDKFAALGDAASLRSAVAQRTALAHHAAALAAGVEATRRVIGRSSDLLAAADDFAVAGHELRAASLHLSTILAHTDAIFKALGSAALVGGDDELRLNASHAEAARHWRALLAAARAVRSGAERVQTLAKSAAAAPAAAASPVVQQTSDAAAAAAQRDLLAAEERIKGLVEQLAADKSLATAAAKREATLAADVTRLTQAATAAAADRDAALKQVQALEKQLASATAAASAAAAAAAAAASGAAGASDAPTSSSGVVTLQHASEEQLEQLAHDVALKAKNDVLKEALRSASRAADDLVTVTLDRSGELAAFVNAAKSSAAALTRPLQLAVQILSSARRVPLYVYEGGTEDAELLARYKRAIFDLISDAKRIRTGGEGGSDAVSERDTLQLEFRRSAVKTQLFFFGKCIEQVVYSGVWL